MKIEMFNPSVEGKARVLVMISSFTHDSDDGGIFGWAKLFRIDFLVRYPEILMKILENRRVPKKRILNEVNPEFDIEGRMMMYKYGPWDPSHYEHAASLYASGLIKAERRLSGMWLEATEKGLLVSDTITEHEDWTIIDLRIKLVRDYLDLSARRLTELISDASPNFRLAQMGDYI